MISFNVPLCEPHLRGLLAEGKLLGFGPLS